MSPSWSLKMECVYTNRMHLPTVYNASQNKCRHLHLHGNLMSHVDLVTLVQCYKGQTELSNKTIINSIDTKKNQRSIHRVLEAKNNLGKFSVRRVQNSSVSLQSKDSQKQTTVWIFSMAHTVSSRNSFFTTSKLSYKFRRAFRNSI